MKVGNYVAGSSKLPYRETGEFVQTGLYNYTYGSAVASTNISAQISSTPNSFSNYTTGGVAWSAMARVP